MPSISVTEIIKQSPGICLSLCLSDIWMQYFFFLSWINQSVQFSQFTVIRQLKGWMWLWLISSALVWPSWPSVSRTYYLFDSAFFHLTLPSVLWRCWLGGRKGIRPVKNWAVECWCGYLSKARCRLAYGQAYMPLTHSLHSPLTVSCFSKIQIGFTFLVPAHPGTPRQRAAKRVCVCVCVCHFLVMLKQVSS